MRARAIAAFLLLPAAIGAQDRFPFSIRATRLPANPVISESMLSPADGGSINGPSLIRVPSWVRNPLGKYYLYFAHHAGKYIRLAYADRVEGPYRIHPAGALPMDGQKALSGHIASPEAVIDDAARKIYLYYHGRPAGIARVPGGDPEAGQKTSVAVSVDGLNFQPLDIVVGPAYLRVFRHRDRWFAINNSTLFQSGALGKPFEPVGEVIGEDIEAAIDPARLGEPGARADRPGRGPDRYSIRHVGVDLVDGRLIIYFSCVGHRPERLYATSLDLSGDPSAWQAQGALEVLHPEKEWEGAHLPLAYSRGGRSRQWENGLRDPAVFREAGKAWLLYSTAGEHGIGLAELHYTAR